MVTFADVITLAKKDCFRAKFFFSPSVVTRIVIFVTTGSKLKLFQALINSIQFTFKAVSKVAISHRNILSLSYFTDCGTFFSIFTLS